MLMVQGWRARCGPTRRAGPDAAVAHLRRRGSRHLVVHAGRRRRCTPPRARRVLQRAAGRVGRRRLICHDPWRGADGDHPAHRRGVGRGRAGRCVVGGLWLEGRRTQRRLRAKLAAAQDAPRTAAHAEAAGADARRVRQGRCSRPRTWSARRGVGGAIRSSINDLAGWAQVERPDLMRLAGPDGSVAILFSDIEGSTELNERLGDKQWVRLLRPARRRGALGGRAAPRPRGQDPGRRLHGRRSPRRSRRCACAIAVQQAFDKGRRRGKATVLIRIGIHHGDVVHRDNDIFGRNVAQAARVAALADGRRDPGQRERGRGGRRVRRHRPDRAARGAAQGTERRPRRHRGGLGGMTDRQRTPRRGRPATTRRRCCARRSTCSTGRATTARAWATSPPSSGSPSPRSTTTCRARSTCSSEALDEALDGLEAAITAAERMAGATAYERLRSVVRQSVEVLVAAPARGDPAAPGPRQQRGRAQGAGAGAAGSTPGSPRSSRPPSTRARSAPTSPPDLVSRLLFGMVNSLVEWHRPGREVSGTDLAEAIATLAFDGLHRSGA